MEVDPRYHRDKEEKVASISPWKRKRPESRGLYYKITVHSFWEKFDDYTYANMDLDIDTKKTALKASPSVVSVVSLTGGNALFMGSGTIIDCENVNGTYFSTILTSASLLRSSAELEAVPEDIKIDVYVSDGKLFEGRVFAYDFHFNIAFIKIESNATLPTASLRLLEDSISIDPNDIPGSDSFQLRPHSNVSKLCPGDIVVAVGRFFDAPYNLMAARGQFSLDCCKFDCKELFRANCKISKCGIGGPLINHYGEVIGVNFYDSLCTPFLPINLVSKCLEHFKKYGATVDKFVRKKMTEPKGQRKDFVWKYVKEVDGEKYFRCKFCDQTCSGTVSRFKNHLAGTHKGIKPCSKVPEDVKLECQHALKNFFEQKSARNEMLYEIGMGAGAKGESGASQSIEGDTGDMTQPPKPRGPMDKFASSQARQSTLNSKWKQEERKDVCRKIGRFIYCKALPFNLVNDPYWVAAVDGIANYGPGFKPPSMHELRTWILKAEVEDINVMMEEHKKAWKQYGCSIMSDGWTDGKSRVLINFLVNSPAGTWFLKSIDASDTIKNGELMFNYLDSVVDEIGEDNVVQVITDNASNYVNAGSRLMEKRKKLYWTPCAAHCIDLMLEDIGKLKVCDQTLSLARQVVKFIYGHCWVLSMMRSFTKNNELLRPAVTRFATAYLTLQSLYKQKQPLQAMFSSEKWASSSWARKVEGVKARATVLFDPKFWPNVAFCIKSTIPLVSVLREVDSEERPAMGYIYELMDLAKEKIAFNCGGNVRKYGPIWNKIDARWTPQLHRPLHAAGYYLNPQLRYRDSFSNVEEVRQGLYQCMDRMLSYDERLKADIQLDYYDQAKGEFGSRVAIDSRAIRSPADWWIRFGSKTPELTKFAIRILSLTCSASGCERNWSTFESIHTKKRNRLEHKRLNALVYVKYNTKLRERSIRRRQNIDPILINEIDSDDEWIAEKEDPVLSLDASWLDEEELFDAEAIRTVPITTYDRSVENRSTTTTINVDSSSNAKKRKVGEGSRNDRGKGKAARCTLVDEDTELEEVGGIDDGTYPIIDIADEDDDNIDVDDLE